MSADRERQAMVSRLERRGITDDRVLAAMRELPRERFVPPQCASDAYGDGPLGIGLGQTISAPWIVAFSAAELHAGPDASVLEVGTGSGYGAAVLARCHRTVVTVERHPELAERAATVLAELGLDNVEVRVGDGAAGAPDRAPFDGIVVTAMAHRRPPGALLDQLTPDGTLICPVSRWSSSHGTLRRYRGGCEEKLVPVLFVPLVTSPRD
jgi:protein-L-isoaspartate(D-aspartate) O-methyltransferase